MALMDTYHHENSQENKKKYNLSDKPFAKDNFFYDNEIMTYIRPLGQPLYKISEYTYKNKSRISHWTKECKTCPNAIVLLKRKSLQSNPRLWKPFQN